MNLANRVDPRIADIPREIPRKIFKVSSWQHIFKDGEQILSSFYNRRLIIPLHTVTLCIRKKKSLIIYFLNDIWDPRR